MLSNPTCHSHVDHSLGNAVFNHAAVGGISSDVVQEGNQLHSDVFGVQLVAGGGSEGQVLPSVTAGRPAQGRAREPARGFALHRGPMAAVLHLHHGHAEGFGRENRERVKTRQVVGTKYLTSLPIPGISRLPAAWQHSTAWSQAKNRLRQRALYRLGCGRMSTRDPRTPRT